MVIERILPGGLGLAHANDRTVMVSLAAPGDRLRVRIDRVKGSVAFASIAEITEPSPVRIEPPCPYFGRCGGCDFQQLNYQAQLDAKIAIIRDCLHRIARIEPVPEFEIVPAPNQWHYRARAQWQYDSGRRRLGYFEANSNRVCDVAECAVLAPELQWVLEDLRALMADGSLSDEARYFRAILGDENALLTAGPTWAPVLGDQAASEGSVPDELEGITRTVAGEAYRIKAESFFQTNVDLLPQLIDYALSEARGENAVELYCGVGLFTLPLARKFKHVVGVEDNTDAAIFARENLAGAGLQNAEVVNCDVGDWLGENFEWAGKVSTRRERRFGSSRGLDESSGDADENGIQSAVKAGALQIDFLLLDPPRTGVESRVISGILRLKPQRVCYVSCDPATLARDLKKLIAGGYRIDRLRTFDMFPQTHHVEMIVHMRI